MPREIYRPIKRFRRPSPNELLASHYVCHICLTQLPPCMNKTGQLYGPLTHRDTLNRCSIAVLNGIQPNHATARFIVKEMRLAEDILSKWQQCKKKRLHAPFLQILFFLCYSFLLLAIRLLYSSAGTAVMRTHQQVHAGGLHLSTSERPINANGCADSANYEAQHTI